MPARAPRVTRSEAVVLRHRRFGDSDRIVTLLTPARGKIDAIAKGALRPRSRLAGHLEPLTHADVLLAHGRNLDIITQAQAIEGFAAIRDDLERLSLALYLLELADRFTVEHAEADAVYQLLLVALLRLARGDGEQLVARSFELGLLDATGFRPEWRDCAACTEPVSPDLLAWSPLAGGVICASCRGSHPEARPIEAAVLKVLRFIQQEPYEQAARVRLSPELASSLEWVMHELMRAMAERELGSARFVSEVRRTAAPSAAASEAPDAAHASAEPGQAYTEPDSVNA